MRGATRGRATEMGSAPRRWKERTGVLEESLRQLIEEGRKRGGGQDTGVRARARQVYLLMTRERMLVAAEERVASLEKQLDETRLLLQHYRRARPSASLDPPFPRLASPASLFSLLFSLSLFLSLLRISSLPFPLPPSLLHVQTFTLSPPLLPSIPFRSAPFLSAALSSAPFHSLSPSNQEEFNLSSGKSGCMSAPLSVTR